MADTKAYTVEINGIPHTVLLSEDEADRRGLVESKGRKPANKSITPENKAV